MKSSSIFIGVLLAFGLLGAGCKSPTSVSSAPYVTISPSNLRQAEFVVDTFQARIFNHDLAQTYFGWNMGDSSVFTPVRCPTCNFQAIHNYTKPGTYAVTVNAFDLYSNTIITSTTTSVTIDTAKSTVEIIPQFYNGIQTMNNFGLTPFALSVKTSLPDNDLYQFWDFGDGTSGSFLSGSITHTFPQPGLYLLKVDVYQRSGVFVGTDTAAITINWPGFNLADIKQTGRVDEYLNVDSTYSIFSQVENFQPLAIGEPYDGSSSWIGNNFMIDVNNGTLYVHFSGSLSDDGKNITSLVVTAVDSSGSSYSMKYSYSLTTIPLISVTDNSFIYKVSRDTMKSNLQNLSLTGLINSVRIIGNPTNWGLFMNRNNTNGTFLPQCVFVFSKQ